jgi:hypothetical protein
MSRSSLVLARYFTALGFLATVAGVAEAKDFCIMATPLQVVAVGAGFAVPAKGKCKPFSGYVPPAASTVSGTGCTSTDGAHLYLTITRSIFGGTVIQDQVSLSLPGLTGNLRESSLIAPAGLGAPIGVSAAKCTAPPLP